MTLREFENNLKETFPDTYELAAPQGMKRFVVWHRYGRRSYYGDNRNVLDLPKVQIEIVSNIDGDYLVEDVCAALWAMDLPYSVESEGYDPEYNAYRTILQTEVA